MRVRHGKFCRVELESPETARLRSNRKLFRSTSRSRLDVVKKLGPGGGMVGQRGSPRLNVGGFLFRGAACVGQRGLHIGGFRAALEEASQCIADLVAVAMV